MVLEIMMGWLMSRISLEPVKKHKKYASDEEYIQALEGEIADLRKMLKRFPAKLADAKERGDLLRAGIVELDRLAVRLHDVMLGITVPHDRFDDIEAARTEYRNWAKSYNRPSEWKPNQPGLRTLKGLTGEEGGGVFQHSDDNYCGPAWLYEPSLSVRAMHVLQETGFQSREEAESATIMDLIAVPGCGRTTALEIAAELQLKPFDFDQCGCLSPFRETDIPFLAERGNILTRATQP